MRIHALIVVLLVCCLFLPPVEAGLLSWLAEKFWFLNPLNLIPGYRRVSSSNRVGSSGGNSVNFGGNVISSGGNSVNIGGGDISFGGNIISRGGSVTISGKYSSSDDNFPITEASKTLNRGPISFGGGQFYGTSVLKNFGDKFKIRILQYMGKNNECEEEIMIIPKQKEAVKTFYTKCLTGYGSSRKVINSDLLVMIGNPNENFCAFTTNENVIYYLQNENWKKGDFTGNDKNDKDLTRSEISNVKERIKKWQDFFEKSKREKERIRGLMVATRDKKRREIDRLRNLQQQERNNYYNVIKQKIRQSMNSEIAKHTAERNKIYNIRSNEGWSNKIDELQAAEERRHNQREKELNQMEANEEKTYESRLKDLDSKMNNEDNNCDRELRRLDNLLDQENKNTLNQLKKNIKQGW